MYYQSILIVRAVLGTEVYKVVCLLVSLSHMLLLFLIHFKLFEAKPALEPRLSRVESQVNVQAGEGLQFFMANLTVEGLQKDCPGRNSCFQTSTTLWR